MSIQKNTPNFLRHSGLSFTTLINQTINCIKDPATLGIYCYLSSKPDTWEINEVELQRRFDKGRDYIRARMADLKHLGLLKSRPIKNAKGQIIRWETTLINFIPNQITENPYSGEIDQKSTAQNTEKPEYGFSRSLDDPLYINKREIEIKEKTKSIVDLKSTSRKISLFPSYKDDVLFMKFYKLYPNKQKPYLAYKAFLKHKPTTEFVEMLIEDINKRMDANWQGRDKSKIPHPATYLNSMEWEGEIYNDMEELRVQKEQKRKEAEELRLKQEQLSQKRADEERKNNESKFKDGDFYRSTVKESVIKAKGSPVALKNLLQEMRK